MIFLFWLIEVIALFSAFCRASFLLKEPSQLICFHINDPPGNFYVFADIYGIATVSFTKEKSIGNKIFLISLILNPSTFYRKTMDCYVLHSGINN